MKNTNDGWEEQRGAMFDAWKRKEEEKWTKCEEHGGHRWNTVEPYHCLDCGFYVKL
jgi:hypothetical protein